MWEGREKLAIGVLTYRRPDTLDKTLESFIRLNLPMIDRFIIIVLIQDPDDETFDVAFKHRRYIKEIFTYKENKGAGWGCSKTLEHLLEYGTEFVTFLEDDWMSTEPLIYYLDFIFYTLRRFEDIGYVRLRSVRENVHTIRVNRFTKEDFWFKNIYFKKDWRKFAYGEGEEVFKYFPFRPSRSDYVDTILRTNAHFTLNPSVYRSSMIKTMLPIRKEMDALSKYNELGLNSAQLNAHCFRHVGVKRVKEGWNK